MQPKPQATPVPKTPPRQGLLFPCGLSVPFGVAEKRGKEASLGPLSRHAVIPTASSGRVPGAQQKPSSPQRNGPKGPALLPQTLWGANFGA